MPLIMDDGINVDDLFGESGSLELGLPPSNSPIKGLAQRLDEMRLVGCCQKIAWSRLGCIAYISPDGLRVHVRHLQCRPSDGKWVLSDDTPLLPVTEAHGGHPLVHLCWNETGAELAVVDSSGRISIYSLSIALNSIAGHRQAAFDPDDDGAQIVGMMWLNINRMQHVHAFHQAAKVQGRWAYSPFRRRPIGPFHPVNKAGLVCVTRSGMVRFLYQNPDSRWAEISAELKNTGYTDRLLTHAALVSTQGGILVATHSACQKICLYRIHIAWSPTQYDPGHQKPPAPWPVPSLRFLHCKVESPSDVIGTNRNQGDNPQGLPSFTNSLYSLTRLDIILPALDNPTGSTSNPWIMAVYSSPLHATPDHPQQQGPANAIVRWQLDTGVMALHPKFDEVASKKVNVQMKPKLELRRLEDIYSDRYIISIDQIEYGNVIAITYDDGSIAFHDPKTMAVFNGVDDTNTVTSLAQAGFHYPPEASGIHISFSPNACTAVMLDAEGQTQLRLMEHSYGAEGGLHDENKYSAAIAALTLAFCRGCGSDVNVDDVLLILVRQLSPDAQVTLINEVYRALSINCNFTVEQDKLLSHIYIPRCLSLQAALGFKDKYAPRSLASAIPWAILQARHASVVYALFFQFNKSAPSESHDPDVLRTVLGNTKWALDFTLYILNGLFDLADDFESVSSDQEAFTQKLKSATSLPLIILLSSMSRGYLRFIYRGLRGIQASYATTAPLSGDARIYYEEIHHILEKSPIRIEACERFLGQVDSAVQHAYQGAGFGDAERPGPEKELLVNARVPPVLVSAVAAILRQTVPALASEIDRITIYMGDYSWLGLADDRRTERYRRTRDVDIIKKIPLRMGPRLESDAAAATSTSTSSTRGGKPSVQAQVQGPAPLRRRRCVRCCGVSGDTHPPRSLVSFRMIAKLGLLRSCLCGGMWTLVESNAPAQAAGPPVTQTTGRTPALMGVGLAGPS